MSDDDDNVVDVNEAIRVKRLAEAHTLAHQRYCEFVKETISIIYRCESEPCCITAQGLEILHIGVPHAIDGVRHNPVHCSASVSSALIEGHALEENFDTRNQPSDETHLPIFKIVEFDEIGQMRIVIRLDDEQHDRLIPRELMAAARKCAINEHRYFLMPSTQTIMDASGLDASSKELGDA